MFLFFLFLRKWGKILNNTYSCLKLPINMNMVWNRLDIRLLNFQEDSFNQKQVFVEKQRKLTVYSWVQLAHLLLLLCMYYFGYVLCCVCLFSCLVFLCSCIIFFWFRLESMFPWLLFKWIETVLFCVFFRYLHLRMEIMLCVNLQLFVCGLRYLFQL